MKEIINGLTEMLVENKINSKVEGRRNWVIRAEIREGKKVIPYAGGYGEAYTHGWLSENIATIIEHSVRWYEFTYKKDYLKALETLKEQGFSQKW